MHAQAYTFDSFLVYVQIVTELLESTLQNKKHRIRLRQMQLGQEFMGTGTIQQVSIVHLMVRIAVVLHHLGEQLP